MTDVTNVITEIEEVATSSDLESQDLEIGVRAIACLVRLDEAVRRLHRNLTTTSHHEEIESSG